MSEFKPHDYFKADDQGYISRKVFIDHVRNSYDHMRELSALIKGYDQAIDTYLERWDQNLESLDDSIIGLLHEWIDDSTFATVINEEIFKTKADQVELEKVTTQLAQTENELKSIEHANAKDKITIMNYLGNDQNIHPKVLYFENSWNGYKYWLAYTPYPLGDTSAENPCLAVSNDGILWSVPNGVINPLDPAPSVGYNSDTHLVHREDTNTLEIWWRQVNPTTSTATFYRRTSTNGVDWSPKELLMARTPLASNDYLSPAIIFENGKYKMWSCLGGKVQYCESINASEWTDVVILPIEWGDLSAWHIDVIKTNLGYEMVITAYGPGENNNTSDLYYVLQNEDNSYTKPKLILKRSNNSLAFDHSGIYRSSILKIKGKYHVYYSSLRDGVRSLSLTSGDSISGLNGFIDFRKKDRPEARTQTLTPGSNLTDFEVTYLDILIIPNGGRITLNSLKGGYRGKKIKLLMDTGDTNSGVIIKYSSKIRTPELKDYEFDNYQGVITLVCISSGINERWALEGIPTPTPQNYVNMIQLSGATTLTDYNVDGITSFLISAPIGGVGVIFESLSGGKMGQKIDVVIGSGTGRVKFIYGSRMFTPGFTDYEITTAQMGATLICTNPAGNVWRVF